MRGSMMLFHYEVIRTSDNLLLAEGETTHIVVNSKFEKTALPEKYSRAFTAAARET